MRLHGPSEVFLRPLIFTVHMESPEATVLEEDEDADHQLMKIRNEKDK